MDYGQTTFERRGKVGIITLNRPERLNAWTDQMQAETRDAVSNCNLDPAISAIVFTGAGRAYCAGADIGGWQKDIEGGVERRGLATRGEDNWVQFLRRHDKPTICAINGAAVGVGITHALHMDIRIAGESARFGMFFVKMGLLPELGSSQVLSQLVGTGRAMEWCMTTRMVEAKEALDAGLVTEVVSDDSLLDRAIALAEQVGAQPPGAIAALKKLFYENATDGDIKAVMAREGEALAEARESSDHKEAVAAFLEKREPNFQALVPAWTFHGAFPRVPEAELFIEALRVRGVQHPADVREGAMLYHLAHQFDAPARPPDASRERRHQLDT